MKVVVIGSGLAGSLAALAARASGAEVVVVGRGTGATALWSGVAEVFGPVQDPTCHEDWTAGPRLTVPAPVPVIDPGTRMERLLLRRPFHPYARLGLDPGTTSDLLGQALELLGLDIHRRDEPGLVATVHGTVRIADAWASSIEPGLLAPDRHRVVLGFEHYPAFDPTAVAALLDAQGFPAEGRWIAVPGSRAWAASTTPQPLCQSPATASALLEALDDGALEALARSLEEKVGGRIGLVPPILGRSPEAHGRLMKALAAPVLAELASSHRSLHGMRLWQSLQEATVIAGIELIRADVTGLRAASGRIVSLDLESGASLEGESFVLATGRAIAGGVQVGGTIEESLMHLPLYLDGAPLDPRGPTPQSLVSRFLLDDHRLFRLGVGISGELRPLDANTRVAYDNLFAAGSVIGGTDLARDGSAFGVSLATGLLAGQWAATGKVGTWA